VDGEYEDILPIKDDTIHYVKWRITAVRKNGIIEFLIATGIDITERIEAERAIDHLNKDLERHANELEYSNKELESFSYSVSHDLKSPLRSIVGLSQILLEDYAEYVDDEGHELINRIVNNGKHMSQLIDDILVLSRVTRQEITLQKINLSSVADMIVSDLQKNQPDRTIEIKIQQNCITNADARLMNIVLTNIIGNAWKYTQKKDNPRIEFGCLKKNDKTVFFVKDNGAGFDIKQIGKLFIPFQRLHSDNDFPGIGVGLATVARIIKRHHGEIWAEGEPDKGAIFYFVIGGGT
jgi:light-regulated signal transduction histidine kinase (bacteriophytochrome)